MRRVWIHLVATIVFVIEDSQETEQTAIVRYS